MKIHASDIDRGPAMKILTIINTSSYSPAKIESSAMPRASPPAENVPRARLNPLLSVAPTSKHQKHILSWLNQASL